MSLRSRSSAKRMKSLLKDLMVEVDLRIFTDATTGKAMAARRGLGKVRHISTNELWIQEKVQNNELSIVKIKKQFQPG